MLSGDHPRLLLVLALVLGCGDAGEPVVTADSAPPPVPSTSPASSQSTPSGVADTSTPAAPACEAVPGHPLRIRCTPTRGTGELVLSAEGAPTRHFVHSGEPLIGWGLRPDTEYAWVLDDQAGTHTTGSLPPGLAAVDFHVSGVLEGADAVLLPTLCDDESYLATVDGTGGVVDFVPAQLFGARMHAYRWLAAERAILELSDGGVLEHRLDGSPGLSLEYGVDFDAGLHHDLTRVDGHTFVLFEEWVEGTQVDGVFVFAGGEQVARRSLADVLDIPPDAGTDWTHANSLHLSEAGELVISLHTPSAVVALDGDPASATFLALRWVASGDGPELPSDWLPTSPRARFVGQHDVRRLDDELLMFDNLGDPSGSRALRLRLEADGRLTHVAEWPVDEVCPVQGGAEPLDGGVLVTCATGERVQAFRDGERSARWTLEATCGDGGALSRLTRAQPVVIR